ncbi:hypothetical protein PanWU01x14_097360 [Parasponia andersonii]|uniref:Uncharacterized protein n=1 Tax=Parasponia andersonii TaxID=3476 RepID=A0A2P5D4H0_PARAD|nr:hypothetical protein PanWU01x14_097360 [Parasponia andersonii]
MDWATRGGSVAALPGLGNIRAWVERNYATRLPRRLQVTNTIMGTCLHVCGLVTSRIVLRAPVGYSKGRDRDLTDETQFRLGLSTLAQNVGGTKKCPMYSDGAKAYPDLGKSRCNTAHILCMKDLMSKFKTQNQLVMDREAPLMKPNNSCLFSIPDLDSYFDALRGFVSRHISMHKCLRL